MKALKYLDKEIQRKIAKITKSILDINVYRTATYIRIDDNDNLILDDFFTVEYGTPISISESTKYLIMLIHDMQISDEMIERYIDNIEYIKIDEGEEYIYTPTEESKKDYIYKYLFRKLRMKEVMVQLDYYICEYNDKKLEDNC